MALRIALGSLLEVSEGFAATPLVPHAVTRVQKELKRFLDNSEGLSDLASATQPW